MLKTIVLIAAAFTLNDIKNNTCWVIGTQGGYDSGFYDEKADECLYVHREKFKDAAKGRTVVQTNYKPSTVNYYLVPY